MIKLNNKGFAISTLLYSLLIMAFLIVGLLISHMSSNRVNTSTLVKKIEEELNRYSETNTDFSPATDEGQEFIVPYGKAGWYKIELWGAAGGGNKDGTENGNGAYTSGIIYLEENDHLYFYLGKQGNNGTGGFNGGGNADSGGKGGGGATDVRLENGGWNDSTSLKSRIMVAAGGGGQNSSGSPTGAGGTLVGKKNVNTYGSATQIAGANFGIGANATGGAGGGGGGYYGGLANEGGSSYIAGYAGVDSIDSSGTHTAQVSHLDSSSRNFYFINGYMASGANSADGNAKIELISQNAKNDPPAKKDTRFTNVTQIRDCITGSSLNNNDEWIEIQAISNGINVAKNLAVANVSNANYATNGKISDSMKATSAGEACATITFSSPQNLDEIAVWHGDFTKDVRYKNHRLSIISGGTTNVIKGSLATTELGLYESATGFHYSAWHYDSSTQNKELPNGNYYIYSALAENGAVTITGTNKNVETKNFNAAKTQKWYVEKVDATYYKIQETSDSYAMQNADGTNEDGENVSAHTKFGNHDWELWEIKSLGNGTYSIKSKLGTYLTVNSTAKNSFNNIHLKTTETKDLNQRFRFVPAEY